MGYSGGSLYDVLSIPFSFTSKGVCKYTSSDGSVFMGWNNWTHTAESIRFDPPAHNGTSVAVVYDMCPMIRLTLFWLLVCQPCTSLVAAESDNNTKRSYQDLQALVDTADKYLLNYLAGSGDNPVSQLELSVMPPDQRLRLRPCDTDLESFFPYKPTNMRRVSVGVRCVGQVKWKVFLQAHLKRYKELAHLNTSVAAGQVLKPDMISMRKTDIYAIEHSGIEDYSTLIGQVFKRNVQHETPLAVGQLALPIVVKKGEFVRILASAGTVQVHAQGDALADGYRHQSIKVKNSSTGKVVNAVVVEAGVVRALN